MNSPRVFLFGVTLLIVDAHPKMNRSNLGLVPPSLDWSQGHYWKIRDPALQQYSSEVLGESGASGAGVCFSKTSLFRRTSRDTPFSTRHVLLCTVLHHCPQVDPWDPSPIVSITEETQALGIENVPWDRLQLVVDPQAAVAYASNVGSWGAGKRRHARDMLGAFRQQFHLSRSG